MTFWNVLRMLRGKLEVDAALLIPMNAIEWIVAVITGWRMLPNGLLKISAEL